MAAGPNTLPDRNNTPNQKPAFTEHPAQSPLFNPGDGTWNNGEAASAAGIDHGGIIDWAFPTAVLDGNPSANVFAYEPTPGAFEGWVANPVGGAPTFWRGRGYLRNARIPNPGASPTDGRVDDAAFEIVVPAVRDPSKPTAIILHTPQTLFAPTPPEGIGADIGFHFGYLAWRSHNGLIGEGFVPLEPNPPQADPTPTSQAAFGPMVPAGLLGLMEARRGQGNFVNLIMAQVVARTAHRPALFQMQRNLELVRAVREIFTNIALPSPFWRPPVSLSILSISAICRSTIRNTTAIRRHP